MDPLKENILVSTADFIDEYRLLCVNEGELVLWDLSAKGNIEPVEFKLEQISVRCGSVKAKDVLRRYELDNAHPFCVNPEKGIVVVTVEGYPGFDVLVVPTKVFTRFKGRGRVKWEEWSKFATKFQLPPVSSFYVFHTYILCLDMNHEDISVFDFSPYCREVVRKEPSMQDRCVPEGDTIMPCQPSSDPPRPLAVTHLHHEESKIPTSGKSYPTEHGIFFIEVRIPVVAKRKF